MARFHRTQFTQNHLRTSGRRATNRTNIRARVLLVNAITIFLTGLHSATHGALLEVSFGPGADFSSIQVAIEAATEGDTILVGPGTYNEVIDFIGKRLLVASESGSQQTVISGKGLESSVVQMTHNEPVGTELRGFTITGGSGSTLGQGGTYGGGLLITNAQVTLRDNIICSNSARIGGGLSVGFLSELPPAPPQIALIGNTICHNASARIGGGAFIGACDVIIFDNNIVDNATSFDGGGLYIGLPSGSAEIAGNVFSGNFAEDHGGGLSATCEPSLGCRGIHISRNIFTRNRANGSDVLDTGSGGAIHLSGPAQFTIEYNTIYKNSGYGESACSGGGIATYALESVATIQFNILASNDGCGITCRGIGNTLLGTNILWGNGGLDADPGSGACNFAPLGHHILADPQICTLSGDTGGLASSSIALAGPQLFGANSIAECTDVAVRPSTWSQVKLGFLNVR